MLFFGGVWKPSLLWLLLLRRRWLFALPLPARDCFFLQGDTVPSSTRMSSSNFNNRGRFEEGGEWIKSSAVMSSGVVVATVLVVRRFRFGASGALSFRTTYGVVSSSCGKTVFCAVRFGVVGGGLWLCCLVTLVGDLRFCRRKCEVSWSIVGGERGSFVFLELFGVAVGRVES